MNKIVINTCYGGFSVSRKALERYWELKDPNKKLYFYKLTYDTDNQYGKYVKCKEDETEFIFCLSVDLGDEFTDNDKDKYSKTMNDDYYISQRGFVRHDPLLVRVVEELGEDANGDYAELEIVETNSNFYRIDEYDGFESLVTPEMDAQSYTEINNTEEDGH